jgi:hypothetical protein
VEEPDRHGHRRSDDDPELPACPSRRAGEQIVSTGYGTQTKANVTGATEVVG